MDSAAATAEDGHPRADKVSFDALAQEVLIPLQDVATMDAGGADGFSETSLTDFLFDDDINLNEPLPLISSTGPESSMQDDSWRQDPGDSLSGLPGDTAVTSSGPKIDSPHEHDVLLGRGGRNNQWSGNEMLRTMAKGMADRYAQAHKRDKPGLAWVLVTQMRQLDPPTRFLKQTNGSGEWFEVADDVAKEKASQCLRDIVAAQKLGGISRKRAFASAPELVTAKRQRSAVVGGQNATFDAPQFSQSSLLGAANPLLAMLATNSSQIRPTLPPKAISCMSLGLSHRISSMAPAASTTVHQDPLLRQLQLLRAQNSTTLPTGGNMSFSQQPAMISQTNMMSERQQRPSMNFGGARGISSTSNATWDIQPVKRQQMQEPMPCASSVNTDTDDSALRRWIDRIAQEEP